MARRGRKRKSGRRHPSGDLVRDKRPDDRLRVARQPHRRGLKEDDRLSEKAESPLGRLNLKRIINDDEYEGGTYYAAVVGAYRAVIEAPRGTAGSGRGVGCLAERFGRADACYWDPASCTCLRRKERYDSAFEALMRAGQRAARMVARVAVFREDVRWEDVVYLKSGLDALARHFGLTGRRGGGHSENTH